MIEEIKVGKNSSYIRKNGKYWYREYNPYTNGVSLHEVIFDEKGHGQAKLDNHNTMICNKEKLEILFITDGRELDE